MQRWIRVLLRIPVTLVFAGALLIALVRLAPGYGIDDREMDPRFDADGIEAIRKLSKEPPVMTLVKEYASKVLRGDWGNSEIFGAPVQQLFEDRWKTTLWSVAGGIAIAWPLALGWVCIGIAYRPLGWAGSAVSLSMLAVPSGVVAMTIAIAGAPVALGIAAAIFPQVFSYVRELMLDAMDHPCVAAASARGVSRAQIILRHGWALVRPRVLSLLGSSAAAAVGSAIPMEAISGVPGLGQLTWRAALGRDLALLLPLVLATTALIQAASSITDLFSGSEESPRAV